MKRRISSAVLQLSALILATIVCVEAISFALILGMPAPEPEIITIRMASEALRANSDQSVRLLRRRVSDAPPHGEPAALIESAMTSLYGIDRDRLHATWASERSVRIEGAERLSGSGARDVAASARSADQLFSTLETLPLPPFRASVRQSDGTWLTVEPREPLLSAWQIQMLAAFFISAVLLIPVAILAARRFTRPLRDLAHFAGADGDAAAPAPTRGLTREIAAALDAIARMRDRLRRRADQRVRILAAVAHDLRTPMTGLRLRIEDATEPDRTQMISDLDRMEDMIGHMLAYARDGVDGRQMELIDVNTMVARVAASFSPGKVLVIRNRHATELIVDGNALERAIGNLVRNAIDYGGSAEIDVRTAPMAVIIGVHDRGPGIAAKERARVVLPFERGENSRNRRTGGVGLGLSMVDEFTRRCGGELHLLDRSGGGLTAEMILPLTYPRGREA